MQAGKEDTDVTASWHAQRHVGWGRTVRKLRNIPQAHLMQTLKEDHTLADAGVELCCINVSTPCSAVATAGAERSAGFNMRCKVPCWESL